MLKKLAKKALKAPVKLVINEVKKLNPLDKKIDMNSTTDTGADALKAEYKTIKTTQKTIKTAKTTIKTTEKATKATIKTTKKATETTVKATKIIVTTTVKATVKVANAAIEVIAAISSPIVLIILVALVLIVGVFAIVIVVIGGDNTNKVAMTNAVGLIDVAEQYKKGAEMLEKAVNDKCDKYNHIIDSLVYDTDNLAYSDLIYAERTRQTHTIYEKSFANNTRKNNIKGMWEYNIEEQDFLAITYVYLEREKNTEKKTDVMIYEVEYTQEVIEKILNSAIPVADTIIERQECPNKNCMKSTSLLKEAINAEEKSSLMAQGYNEWVDITIDLENGIEVLDERIDNWWYIYGEVAETYPFLDNNGNNYLDVIGARYEQLDREATAKRAEYDASEVCEHNHTLHNVGIAFYSADELMDLLKFDDADKEWVKLTKEGFENNPDIGG